MAFSRAQSHESCTVNSGDPKDLGITRVQRTRKGGTRRERGRARAHRVFCAPGRTHSALGQGGITEGFQTGKCYEPMWALETALGVARAKGLLGGVGEAGGREITQSQLPWWLSPRLWP